VREGERRMIGQGKEGKIGDISVFKMREVYSWLKIRRLSVGSGCLNQFINK